MNFRNKFKEMVMQMYQLKPIAAYLLGRATDTISTYLNVKKYSPEGELNVLVRKLFYELGVESSITGWFALSVLYIPVFYTSSKMLEKLTHKLVRKNVEIWKELYYAHLYGSSAGSFYASINNLLFYLNLPHISAEHVQIFSAMITALPFCFYGRKIYKKLKS